MPLSVRVCSYNYPCHSDEAKYPPENMTQKEIIQYSVLAIISHNNYNDVLLVS